MAAGRHGRRHLPRRPVHPPAAHPGMPARRIGRYDLGRGRSRQGDMATQGRPHQERRSSNCPPPRARGRILAAVPHFTGPFLFSTTYGKRPISGFGKIKQTLDHRIAEDGGKPLAGWRLHDLRRTMRTNLSALAILPVVAELMIGHRQRGIAAVYDLHAYEAEQRAGFEAWSARLVSIVDPSDRGNIVAFPAAR